MRRGSATGAGETGENERRRRADLAVPMATTSGNAAGTSANHRSCEATTGRLRAEENWLHGSFTMAPPTLDSLPATPGQISETLLHTCFCVRAQAPEDSRRGRKDRWQAHCRGWAGWCHWHSSASAARAPAARAAATSRPTALPCDAVACFFSSPSEGENKVNPPPPQPPRAAPAPALGTGTAPLVQ